MKPVIIIGGGGHARSIRALLNGLPNYEPVGYTAMSPGDMGDLPYLGDDRVLPRLFADGIRTAVLGVGSIQPGRLRRRLLTDLMAIGFELPVIKAVSAVVADDVQIGAGTVLFERAVVNARTRLGEGVIINTGAVVEHDCVVGDFTHLAPASVLGGGVRLDADVHVGLNATVIENRVISSRILIGAGAVVCEDCLQPGVYVGVPARRLRGWNDDETGWDSR
ncbi:MAG TPA: NeuD/PglB/VioB family sugar acetyltransferase [Bacillota bacterium]|nr:NeuD/PglB/VioB family sugar acetyltransferase [Bacillota bacterium]